MHFKVIDHMSFAMPIHERRSSADFVLEDFVIEALTILLMTLLLLKTLANGKASTLLTCG